MTPPLRVSEHFRPHIPRVSGETQTADPALRAAPAGLASSPRAGRGMSLFSFAGDTVPFTVTQFCHCLRRPAGPAHRQRGRLCGLPALRTGADSGQIGLLFVTLDKGRLGRVSRVRHLLPSKAEGHRVPGLPVLVSVQSLMLACLRH